MRRPAWVPPSSRPRPSSMNCWIALPATAPRPSSTASADDRSSTGQVPRAQATSRICSTGTGRCWASSPRPISIEPTRSRASAASGSGATNRWSASGAPAAPCRRRPIWSEGSGCRRSGTPSGIASTSAVPPRVSRKGPARVMEVEFTRSPRNRRRTPLAWVSTAAVMAVSTAPMRKPACHGALRVPPPPLCRCRSAGATPFRDTRSKPTQWASQSLMAPGTLMSASSQSSNTAAWRVGMSSQRSRAGSLAAVMPSKGNRWSTTACTLRAASSPPPAAAASCAANSATAISIHSDLGSAIRSASERSRRAVSPGSCRPSNTSATSGGTSKPVIDTLPRTPPKLKPGALKPLASATSTANRSGACGVAISTRVPAPTAELVVPSVDKSGSWAHIDTASSSTSTRQRQPRAK